MTTDSPPLTTPKYWSECWDNAPPEFLGEPAAAVRGLLGTANRYADSVLPFLMDRTRKQSGDVLELGCAPGRMIERMSRFRPQHRYHGLDYSEVGVQLTRSRLRSLGRTGDINLGDLHTFEAARRYDLVVSFGLIEHFTDPLPVVKAHARFCSPGGCVGITVPNYSSPMVKWLIQRLDPDALDSHCFEIMNEAAIKRLLTEANLKEVSVGSCGGPRLRSTMGPASPSRKTLRGLARAWNLVGCVLGHRLLWSATIWGSGYVP